MGLLFADACLMFAGLGMLDEPTAELERGLSVLDGAHNYTLPEIAEIACKFKIQEPVKVSNFAERGNINVHTYLVESAGVEYLLQKINADVFTMPDRVMETMLKSLAAQREALASGDCPHEWMPIELVETVDGNPYLDLSDVNGPNVWRLMVRIPEVSSYKSLSEVGDREAQLTAAEETGRGLAIYSDLTSSVDPTSVQSGLPGYRNTDLYFRQFRAVLAGCHSLEEAHDWLPEDREVCAATRKHFLVSLDPYEYRERKTDQTLSSYIATFHGRELFVTGLWKAISEGRIRSTLIHGDTKIENFLFSKETGKAKSLIDLDTCMAFTWLADWGDLVRSMVNVAGEKERDLHKVVVDWDVYGAVAKGFLHSSKEVTEEEINLMPYAVEAITLELGLRFLTDYLRGDTYFQLGPNDPQDLNKVRAMVQIHLYRQLLLNRDKAESAVAEAMASRP
jgi:hypothetical protein